MKIYEAGLSAWLCVATAGCASLENPMNSLGEVLGMRVTKQSTQAGGAYLYYPDYDVYYNRDTGEFLQLEHGRWVSYKYPRDATREQVFRSRSVKIDGYPTPAQHHYDLSTRNPR